MYIYSYNYITINYYVTCTWDYDRLCVTWSDSIAHHSNKDVSYLDLRTPLFQSSVKQSQEALVEGQDARHQEKEKKIERLAKIKIVCVP